MADFDPDKFLMETAPPAKAAPAAAPQQFDPDAFLAETAPPQSIGQKGIDTLTSIGHGVSKAAGWLGSVTDRFTGAASSRAAIGELQKGNSPVRASRAFMEQFGKPAETAPTGKEIAAQAGFSTAESIRLPFKNVVGESIKASPAGIAGLGVDILADPTNVVPGKGALKALGVGGEVVGQGIRMGAKATDAVTGTRIAGGITELAAKKAEATRLALKSIFSPKQAPDFAQMVEIAKKNGINPAILPESVEFGPTSTVTRVARVKAEGPLGQKALEDFQKGQDAVRGAIQKKVSEYGGGVTMSPQVAGGRIREAVDEAVEATLKSMDVTYNSIAKKYPGLQIAEAEQKHLLDILVDVDKFATERLSQRITGSQASQAKDLKNTVNAVINAGGSYEGTLAVMRNIGDAAFKNKSVMDLNPPDVARLRSLYGNLSESLIRTVEKVEGAKVGESLRANNKVMAEFFGDKSALDKIINNRNLADEGVFRELVANGDSRQLAALREILQPEDIGALKAAFVDDLIRKDFDGQFSFARLENALKSPRGQTVLSNFFEPAEVKDLVDLVRLGDRFGSPVMSTSGTGASQAIRGITTSIGDSLIDDAYLDRMKESARSEGIRIPRENSRSAVDIYMEETPGSHSSMGRKAGKGGKTPGASLTGSDLIESIRSYDKRPEWMKRTPTERRSKALQIYSTTSTDENEARRDAIRRRSQGGK